MFMCIHNVYIYIHMNIYIYTKNHKNTSFSTKVLSSFVKKNPPNPPSTSMISQQNVAPGDCERSNDTRPWRSEVSSKNEKTGWTTPFQIWWFIYSVNKWMETDGSFVLSSQLVNFICFSRRLLETVPYPLPTRRQYESMLVRFPWDMLLPPRWVFFSFPKMNSLGLLIWYLLGGSKV